MTTTLLQIKRIGIRRRAKQRPGLTSGQDFNVYNLDPYVWFVHKVEKMSAYGFSVDDDVANPTATGPLLAADGTPNHDPSNLQIDFGGIARARQRDAMVPDDTVGHPDRHGHHRCPGEMTEILITRVIRSSPLPVRIQAIRSIRSMHSKSTMKSIIPATGKWEQRSRPRGISPRERLSSIKARPRGSFRRSSWARCH